MVKDGEFVIVPVNAVLYSNNRDVLRAAALAGRGVADQPTFLVGPDIAVGRLRTVLDRFPQPDFATSSPGALATNRNGTGS
jgi:DNA-binding transcriptional LysR family regulator